MNYELKANLPYDVWIEDLDVQCSIDCEYESFTDAEQMVWCKDDIASMRYEEYLNFGNEVILLD